MRTSLWISLLLLALTIGGGALSAMKVSALSDRYVSAAEEMRILTADGQWERAQETAEAYLKSWKDTVPWLQTLINHEDADDVTMALVRLQAGVEAQDTPMCLEACAELKESALHLYHRDSLTLGNVL